ncbi:MAG: hypothetical protein LBR73_02405 [Oscillospiraceae bacterium]|jgi:hypothetical protein|nr:hypothetical protein [Oscillospiraceae bacterium]
MTEDCVIDTYILQDTFYANTGHYIDKDSVPVHIFPDLNIQMDKLFPPEDETEAANRLL